MNPFYFGSANEPLFGVYSPPMGARPRKDAVLVCPPLGWEYTRTHWALRRLADRLASNGKKVAKAEHASG